MHDQPSRRNLLQGAGLLAATGLLGRWAAPLSGATLPQESEKSAPPEPTARRKRSLRFAHLSDIHVQPERRAGEGLAACLKHVQAQADKPELIVTGGDLVMDSFDAEQGRTKLQWELFTKTVRDECGLPVEHCLGNHDIWGWNKKKSGTTGDEPLYGKKWALETLGLKERYHSFDRGGWRFIILDSVQPYQDGYMGRLDDLQYDWLAGELAKTPAEMPVVITSHIPILSVCAVSSARNVNEKDQRWQVSGGLMHIDGVRLRDLFLKHRNVKLCLSGHIHLNDRVELNGVTYICDGAVSGNWWKGRHQQTDEGYGLVDLFDDGTFEHRYVSYGWRAAAARNWPAHAAVVI